MINDKNSKEYQQRVEDFISSSEKTKKIVKQLEDTLNGNILPKMQEVKKQIDIIENPLNKKNYKYLGQDIIVSQLSDGRIIIHFMNMNVSDRFYNYTPLYNEDNLHQAGEDGHKKGREEYQDMWKEKSLWDRIFKK